MDSSEKIIILIAVIRIALNIFKHQLIFYFMNDNVLEVK